MSDPKQSDQGRIGEGGIRTVSALHVSSQHFLSTDSDKAEALSAWRMQRKFKKRLNFNEINRRAQNFADFIEKNYEKVIDALLLYESYEVAKDETARSLDLLRSLKENEVYFEREIGAVASFLPRNQPLYALSCFAVIPALMAAEVYVRPPLAMTNLFPNLLKAIQLPKFFNNIRVSFEKREDFLNARSAVKPNPKTGIMEPVVDAVIFTGTMENADRIRQKFDERVLFIANGAGHNPVVVTEKADLEEAVFGAMRVQLYNQGQDCASPNTILVHRKKHDQFIKLLKTKLKKIKIGTTYKRNNRIGPISDRRDLKRIQEILVDNAEWIDPTTQGIIHTRTAVVEPTIISRPLVQSGNYTEMFAPVFFIQRYEEDGDLSFYFENPRYEPNAMYISVYGRSKYIDSLSGKRFPSGKILHDDSTIIKNTDLHAEGIERGTQPYGGYGRGASCLSIYGKVISKPTCPQRDIFEHLVYPALQIEKTGATEWSQVEFKAENDHFNVSMAAKGTFKEKKQPAHIVSAVESLTKDVCSKLNNSYLNYVIHLRHTVNREYLNKLNAEALSEIAALKEVLMDEELKPHQLEEKIYEIAKRKGATTEENKKRQKEFFKNVYNLLFGFDKGPRLSVFLLSLKRADIVSLLDETN